tara:strand:+ start:410 stop:1330 length:921 start_codon:yes stop_codon:yes gene_type:complete
MEPKILITDIADFFNISVQAVHQKIKKNNLDCKRIQNKLYLSHSDSKKIINFEFNKKIFAFQIVKGGVGKTTLLHSIATKISLLGAKTLLIDLDQQANLTQACNIDSRDLPVMINVINGDNKIEDLIIPVCDGIDLIPSEIENAVIDSTLLIKQIRLEKVYSKIFNKLKNNYDFIFIDCPPSLGPSVTAASLASDIIVAPVTPEKFSLKGLEILKSELTKLKEDYDYAPEMKIILNKFDSRTAIAHDVLAAMFSNNEYKDNMYKSFVRVNQEFVNVTLNNTSIFDTTRKTAAKEDIALIAKELVGA